MKNINVIDIIGQEKNVVILGKNGVGKTRLLNEIHNDSTFKTIFVDYDLSIKYDQILTELMCEKAISQNKENYNKIKSLISGSVNGIAGALSDFDQDQNRNKYDLVDCKHKIQVNDYDFLQRSISMKYDYNNGKGIDYFLKLQLLLNIIESFDEIILLIDEPERYCFPGLILRLAEILSKHKNKVVCASHSPIFVDAFINDFSELIYLKSRNEKHLYKSKELIETCYRTYEDDLKKRYFKSKNTILSNKERFKTFFNSLLKYNIIESLYADVTILTEGATDKQFVEYILRTNNVYHNMCLIQTNGKDMFPIYISVLKKYGSSIVSIFDLDKYKDEKHTIYNKFIKNNSTSFYGFEDNIEETFSLDKTASREKVYVGPTLLLVKLLDDKNDTKKIINDVIERLDIAHLSNILGKDNLKFEINKLADELNKSKDEEIEDLISKYLMLLKLRKKCYINCNELIKNMNVEKELKYSYVYLENTLNHIQINYDNFEKIVKKYRSNPLFINDNAELIYCYYLYDEKKQRHNLDVFKEYSHNDNKIDLLFECYNTKKCISFQEYVIAFLNDEFLKIESSHLKGEKILSDISISEQLDYNKVNNRLKKFFGNLKFIERDKKIKTIMSAYLEVISKVI